MVGVARYWAVAVTVAALVQPALAQDQPAPAQGQQPVQAQQPAPDQQPASARQPRTDHTGSVAVQRAALAELIAQHASANGVPVALVHRVILRESGYNPRAIYRGNYGLMQIRLGTARALGYAGTALGLLDPVTNMTYAVRYLAGAYRAAKGNERRALTLYARGY